MRHQAGHQDFLPQFVGLCGSSLTAGYLHCPLFRVCYNADGLGYGLVQNGMLQRTEFHIHSGETDALHTNAGLKLQRFVGGDLKCKLKSDHITCKMPRTKTLEHGNTRTILLSPHWASYLDRVV